MATPAYRHEPAGRVRAVHEFMEAFCRLDADAACALACPEFESHTHASVPLDLRQPSVRGHDGLRALIREFVEGWPSFTFDFEVRPLGESFLVTGRYHAFHDESATTGHSAPFVSVVKVCERGDIRSVLSYGSIAEALQSEPQGRSD